MSITEAQLKAKFKASGRNWDQWCQAGVVNAAIWSGGFERTYDSAKTAYHASKIVSKNPKKAPVNAIHYWDIGTYGHVAGGLGGERVFMCSKNIDVKWGTNVGVTTVSRYNARTGAKYLGWSLTNGENKLHIAAPKPTSTNKIDTVDEKNVVKLAKWLNKQKLAGPKTTASEDGKRGKIYWTRIQLQGVKDKLYLASEGYIVDGDPGKSNSKSRQLEKHYLTKA